MADQNATAYAFYPEVNEKGESTIGLNFSDRNYFKRLQAKEEKVISEVFNGRGGVFSPIFTISVPMTNGKKFKGYALAAVNLEKFAEQLKPPFEDEEVYFTILDQNENVIVTNFPERKRLTKFDFSDNKKSYEPVIGEELRTPPAVGMVALISDWNRSFYFRESRLKDSPWKLVLEIPAQNVQKSLFAKIRIIMFISLFFIYLSILISEILSRRILVNFQKLTSLAKQAPFHQGLIAWPDSQVEELATLTESLKIFKEKNDQQLLALNDLNRDLEGKVELRTKELSESEARFRLFFEGNRAPMYLVETLTGQIVEANAAAREFYGWSEDQVKTVNVTSVNILPAEEVLKQIKIVAESGHRVFIFKHRTTNGVIRDVELYVSVFELSGKKVNFVIVHDISSRVANEKLIGAQRLELVNSARMASLGEMAIGLAHEINNPLTIISGHNERIKHQIAVPEINRAILKQATERISSGVDRAAKIIKGLRAFGDKKQDETFVLIKVSTVIDDALLLYAELLKKNGIKLEVYCDSVLKVKGISSQLSQVILNLIYNSAEALDSQEEKLRKEKIAETQLEKQKSEKLTENQLVPPQFENQPEKWIEIKASKEADKIFISVTDSGFGIPAEIAGKIMDPFFTTKEVGRGAGLGLSVASGIMAKHNGQLRYDSNSKHTRFIMELPAL